MTLPSLRGLFRWMANMTTGIYRILNTVTGKSYVGQSQNTATRWRQHKTQLRCGVSKSPKLQASWNKHGQCAFTFSICCVCAIEDLNVMEQRYIDKFDSHANGYNTRPIAESNRGHKYSEQGRANVSAGNNRPEAKARRSQSLKATWADPEYRASRIAAANTPEAKAAMAASVKAAQAIPEVKARVIAGRKAAWNKHGARAAASERKRREWADKTRRRRMIDAMKDGHAKPENKRRKSEAAKASWSDSESRQRRMAAAAKMGQSDAAQAKKRAAMLAMHADPVRKAEYMAKRVGFVPASTRPEIQDKMSASMKAYHASNPEAAITAMEQTTAMHADPVRHAEWYRKCQATRAKRKRLIQRTLFDVTDIDEPTPNESR